MESAWRKEDQTGIVTCLTPPTSSQTQPHRNPQLNELSRNSQSSFFFFIEGTGESIFFCFRCQHNHDYLAFSLSVSFFFPYFTFKWCFRKFFLFCQLCRCIEYNGMDITSSFFALCVVSITLEVCEGRF
jgi:hypothetical protein